VRFLPTIDAMAPGIYEALLSGQLRLQTGQWVRLSGSMSKPSRWIGRKPHGTIWMEHPTGLGLRRGTVDTLSFRIKVAAFRGDRTKMKQLKKILMGGE